MTRSLSRPGAGAFMRSVSIDSSIREPRRQPRGEVASSIPRPRAVVRCLPVARLETESWWPSRNEANRSLTVYRDYFQSLTPILLEQSQMGYVTLNQWLIKASRPLFRQRISNGVRRVRNRPETKLGNAPEGAQRLCASFEFPVSNFEFRVSNFQFPTKAGMWFIMSGFSKCATSPKSAGWIPAFAGMTAVGSESSDAVRGARKAREPRIREFRVP
jgi:hypothetical protein